MVKLSNIKFYTILIVVLIPLVTSQTTVPTNLTENTTISPSLTLSEETFDYVIKLVFGLENEKVPMYLVNSIYENSNNVTIADIIALYSIENMNLSRTTRVLEELGYDPSKFLSVNGLENILNELKLSFKNFYDAIFLSKLNISGIQLRNFLQKLNINTNDFSNAMTYGEGDPLEIFKKGNFSEENLENGLEELGKTKEELFDACRDEILQAVVLKPTAEVITLLTKYKFDENKALQLWKYSKINIDDVNNITVFSDILDDLKFSLEDSTYLGIFTNKYVAINSVVLEKIKDKMRLSKLFAQKLTENNATVDLLNSPKSYNKFIVTLPVDNENFTASAVIGTTTTNLQNCTFVTVENDTLLYRYVENVFIKDDSHFLKVSWDILNVTELILGSPLICNNKVYGLAKNIEDENVIFDSFVVEQSGAATSSTFSTILCLLFCSLIYAIA